MDLDKWGKAVDSFRKLALRSAALESLLEVRLHLVAVLAALKD